MHILLALLALAAGAAYWLYRVRQAADTTRVVLDAAHDVKAAARRFGFRTRANQHPSEGVDDPRVTAAALLVLTAETDGGISKAEQTVILERLQAVFEMSAEAADELYLFAKWLANQSTNPDDMIRRLIKRTVHLGGRDTLPDLIQMVAAVGNADTGTLTDDTVHIIEKLKQLSN
ncbi:TerB family tellurite resistance protein [uncultured Roseibium sp.]|uniref:TerB family tellurite resistance protein n=1 Tax=uncultured Roseibium sp. TaxID=1936171 RepID=UPI002611CC2E|nr:TerB family tellurite resistance protein [uncultured Roseibium sp.]